MDDLMFYLTFWNSCGRLLAQRNGGKTRYFLGLILSKDGPFTFVQGRDYRSLSQRLLDHGAVTESYCRFDLVALGTDLLVRRATSINLQKDEKDKFFKNIMFSSIILGGRHHWAPPRPSDHSSLVLFGETSTHKHPDPPLDVVVFDWA